MQSHTAACKILRGLVNCPPPGSTRDDVCDLFLRSGQMTAVVGVLTGQRGTLNTREGHLGIYNGACTKMLF
jgi:hypothetical protein